MKIGYWITTGLFSLMMLGSAFAYLTGAPVIVEAFHHLGYPDYFRVGLGVAKILGALALVLPFVPATLREWAYAGFVFTMVAAACSHAACGDPVARITGPAIALALVLTSYTLRKRVDALSTKSPASAGAAAL